jgi:hypothetical protein
MSRDFFAAATNFGRMNNNYQIQPGDVPPGSGRAAVDNFSHGQGENQFLNDDREKTNQERAAREKEEQAKRDLAVKEERDRTDHERQYLSRLTTWQSRFDAEMAKSIPTNPTDRAAYFSRLSSVAGERPRLT